MKEKEKNKEEILSFEDRGNNSSFDEKDLGI